LDWDWFTGDCSTLDGCCGWACSFEDNWNRGKTRFSRKVEDGEDDPEFFPIPEPRIREVLRRLTKIGALVVAECHGSLAALIQEGDEVHHFDAHQDDQPYESTNYESFYQRVNCANWVTVIQKRHHADVTHVPVGARARGDGVWTCQKYVESLTKVYRDPNSPIPEIRDPGIRLAEKAECEILTMHPEYDLVFVCKSSPWTPPDADRLLHALVKGLAAKCPTGIRWYGHRAKELRREHARLVEAPRK